MLRTLKPLTSRTARAIRLLAMGVFTAVGVSSCQCGDSTGPGDNEPRPTSIALSTASVSLTFLGATEQITAAVRDQNGATIGGASILWSVDDPSVAQVSTSGEVRAISPGTATVTASSGSLRATARATVTQVPAAVQVTPDSASFDAAADTLPLGASAQDAGGADIPSPAVSWSSSDTLVAAVSATGQVVTRGSGVAFIRASAGPASDSAAIVVDQTEVSLVLTPELFTINALDATLQMDGRVLDPNGERVTDAVIDWTSSVPAAATVDDAGLVTSVADGVTEIVATSGALADSSTITVDQTAGSVVVTPDSVAFDVLGDTLTLQAEVLDGGGAPVPGAVVAWALTDSAAASISSEGLVTAVANGTTSVIASSGTATTLVPVTVAQRVATLNVTPTSLGFAALGDTATLVADPRDAGDNPVVGAVVVWTSLDPGVASVTSGGLVTSAGDGATRIRASAVGVEEEIPVTVSQSAASIEITPANPTFQALGATQTLSAAVRDSAGAAVPGAPVAWTSSDPAIASVDAAGVVTAVANGAATITATSGLAEGTASATVQQVAFTLDITADSLVLEAPGDTAVIPVNVADSRGNPMAAGDLTWVSEDPAAVTVSADGVATAVASGPSTVTATSGGLSDDLIVRTRGSYLDVRVRGDGDLLPDVEVQLTDPGAGTSQLTTDSTGTVRFRNLEAGSYQAAIPALPEGLTVPDNPRAVPVGVDQAVATSFDGVFAPAAVEGSATSWGIPVTGAQVLFEGRDTTQVVVDGAGQFVIDSIARGDYQVTISGFSGVRFRESVQSVFLPSVVTTQVDFVAKPDPEPLFDDAGAGLSHSCAVTTVGEIYCWGLNSSSQLGNGETASATTPQLVDGGLTFASVTVGQAHTCALTPTGEAYCWGEGNNGRLGTGFVTDEAAPAAVVGGLTFSALDAGGAHNCAIDGTGAAYCWGLNASGQAGTGSTAVTGVATPVTGGLTFAQISAGSAHSCGVTTTGEAYCWGRNTFGQLGNGGTNPDSVPALVGGGLTFQQVSAGNGHSCGVTTTGEVYCWGRGTEGQLGNGANVEINTAPVLVSGGSNFAEVGAGSSHTCGRTTGGATLCWGQGISGQLGDGAGSSASTPVTVSGSLPLVSLALGGSHTCAVSSDGRVFCWGLGDAGQLGAGDTADRLDPFQAGGNW